MRTTPIDILKGGLLALSLVVAATQAIADSSEPISGEERQEVLEKIASELRRGYLYEEKGNTFAKQVEEAATERRFAAADTLGTFVSTVNGFLLEISNDKHLRLLPGTSTAERDGPRRRIRRRHAPGGDDSGDAKSPGAAHGKDIRQPAPESDSGSGCVRETRVLDGNIGYLDLRLFPGSDAAKPEIDQAMMSLADTDALIIDLGRNGGGGPWTVRYLSGFFFSGPTQLTETWARGMDSPQERWTLDGQPTSAFVAKPVYILTSGRTFSAAESFTFGLLINDRVTLVGERTGGGGHFGDTVKVAKKLGLFIPGGRTYDPETGKGWEAEGIEPSIGVPYAEARSRAAEAIKARAPSG